MLQRSCVEDRRDAQKHEAAERANLVLDDLIWVCQAVYVGSMASQRFLSDSINKQDSTVVRAFQGRKGINGPH